ncbi:MAG TPA: MarR family transcriptional regulator [Mycobacterium sp.]|nr:MarR family transcriptional regulator [Mycobacterium sp.]
MPGDGSERLHELFMDLVRVAGLLQPDQELPGHSVSLSAAYAIHELDHGAGLSQQELAERLLLEKSTVSRMVADLERKGLVERERNPGNRRTYRLRLTDEGRAFHVRVAEGYGAQYQQWTAAMTPTERDALLIGLPALIRAVRGSRG